MNTKNIIILISIIVVIIIIAVISLTKDPVNDRTPLPDGVGIVEGDIPARNDAQIPPTNGGEAVFCAMDAMQCPDGSWVGRTGSNCQFVCPTQ